MKNTELAHHWAHQTQRSGSGSHFYFDGSVIYSYGPHFPIARLFQHPTTGETCVLFTTRGYSSSTSIHKGYARRAVSHLRIFQVDDVMQKVDRRTIKSLERAEASREEAERERTQQHAKRQAERAAKLLAKVPELVADWRSGKRIALPAAAKPPRYAATNWG